MKNSAVCLLMIAAAGVTAWGAAPGSVPATLPAPTLGAYEALIRGRYGISEEFAGRDESPGAGRAGAGRRGPGGDPRLLYIDLISHAGIVRIPLDVIENVGDARTRFRAQAQASLATLHATLTDLVGQSPSADAESARLREQMSRVEIELEVKDAKEKLVQQRIADMTEKIKAMTDSDEILKSLQSIVELREKNVERARVAVKAAVAPQADLEGAEAQLALAQVEVAKRRADIVATAFGGALGDLNKLLIEVSLDVEEQKTTLKVLSAHVDKFKQADETQKKIGALNDQISILGRLEAAEKALPGPAK